MAAIDRNAEDELKRFDGAVGAVYRGLLASTLVALAFAVWVTASVATGRTNVADPTMLTYPLVWLGVSTAAVVAVGRRWTSLEPWALLVGSTYTIALLYLSGHLRATGTGLAVDVQWGLPGWTPVVMAELSVVHFVIVPFQLIGYATLGYLLGQSLSVTSRSLLAGIGGAFTCAGCLLPITTIAVAGGVPMTTSTLASYPLATAAYVVTVVGLAAVVIQAEQYS